MVKIRYLGKNDPKLILLPSSWEMPLVAVYQFCKKLMKLLRKFTNTNTRVGLPSPSNEISPFPKEKKALQHLKKMAKLSQYRAFR